MPLRMLKYEMEIIRSRIIKNINKKRKKSCIISQIDIIQGISIDFSVFDFFHNSEHGLIFHHFPSQKILFLRDLGI